MNDKSTSDPFSMFRDMVNQWEKAANEYGGKIASTSEFAQGMQGVTAISLQVQQAVQEAMTKVLAAANIPSRDDIATLSARVAAVEAQLSRVVAALGATTASSDAKPKPKRTKQPPQKQK
ncbi:poly(R)-hydroxyalkanoic acid synthase subunit PhaE [Aquisediminimonas profunda]|uniref:poly(R)-hydroxyalkanoic acid synthase subunit PhaE n=1 Tax=Aquisediminimonas profunda TaxID=1550733 RepID=UPI001C625DCA|nr:poly(R)-hydroxyalkanoic acid synthase subunit PhaE [Aquisediminimonas profunda]